VPADSDHGGWNFWEQDHQEQEEALYGSAEWRDGPREEILAMIESYHSVVINASSEAVAALTIGQ